MEMMLNKLTMVFFFFFFVLVSDVAVFLFFLSRPCFFISHIPVKGYISKSPSIPNGLSSGARASDAGNSSAKALEWKFTDLFVGFHSRTTEFSSLQPPFVHKPAQARFPRCTSKRRGLS